MRRNLIVELRPPADGARFRIAVNPSGFDIAAEGYPDALVTSLNSTLEGIRTLNPDAEIFASFPKIVQRLRQIDEAAAGTADVSDRKLALFFRIAFPLGTSAQNIQQAADSLTHSMSLDPIIKNVTEVGGFVPTWGGTQGYVESGASGGLNIDPARDLPGGRGQNVTICLVDSGYQPEPTQPHLPAAPRLKYAPPEPEAPSLGHGTRMLGIVAARRSDAMEGIASGATFRVACTIRSIPDTPLSLLERAPGAGTPDDAKDVLYAIDDAVVRIPLEEGDLLIVPRGTEDHLPIETHDDVRECFRVVTSPSHGITVVEPACSGGGGYDLDNLVGARGSTTDSRAILVGAGQVGGADAKTAVPGSHYGKRIDCQAWGESILTLADVDPWDPNPQPSDYFCSEFGGTSGASAIIGGVAALIQSISWEAKGCFMSPLDIRAKLGRPDLGRSAANAGNEPIGSQPDLMRVLDDCGFLPDVFLRDNKDDTGEEPSPTEDIWCSPDIITRPQAVAPGDLDDWDDLDLAQDVVAGGLNYVYLRAENIGPFDDEPSFKVYWTYPGTFLAPGQWRVIGEATALVPGKNAAASSRTVVGPIAWIAPTDTTHPCLIAVAESTLDPKPPLNPQTNVAQYIDFVRRYNNVAHRNVVTVEPDGQVAFVSFNVEVPAVGLSLRTLIRIVPEQAPDGSLMVIGLPPGQEEALVGEQDVRILELSPSALREATGGATDWQEVERSLDRPFGDRRHRNARPQQWIALDPQEGFVFERVLTAAGRSVPLVLGVWLPEQWGPFGLHVVQELRDMRVGRLNVRFEPG